MYLCNATTISELNIRFIVGKIENYLLLIGCPSVGLKHYRISLFDGDDSFGYPYACLCCFLYRRLYS